MKDNRIRKVAIVGMGALGLLYADQITRGAEEDVSVEFLMDEERAERHRKDVYRVNGEEKSFRICCAREAEPADLVITAVKFPDFHSALDTVAGAIGENTVILSVMNGVTSEETLGERFGREKLVIAVAMGMDAMREGTSLHYTRCGKIYFGTVPGQRPENGTRVREFFERVGVPHEFEADPLQRLWFKFMLNVGVNQTCHVFNVGYGAATTEGTEPYGKMVGAMHEVIALAEKKGIRLTEQDIRKCIDIERTLDPDSTPSMGQDRLAHRPSEVEIFAGDVIRLSEPYGLPTPYNRFFLERVREIEAAYV